MLVRPNDGRPPHSVVKNRTFLEKYIPGGSFYFLSGSIFFTYSSHSFWSSSMLVSPKPAW